MEIDNATPNQHEAIRRLLHAVLTCDIGRFDIEQFKRWVNEMDARFRKLGLSLGFVPQNRSVHFTIKETATGKIAFRFTSPARLRFDHKDVADLGGDLVQPRRAFG